MRLKQVYYKMSKYFCKINLEVDGRVWVPILRSYLRSNPRIKRKPYYS